MSKPVKYIVAIGLLLGANLWLFFSDETTSSKEAEKYFDPEDLDGVSAFEFVFGVDTVAISLTGDGWIVNDEYLADQGFVNTLISVLERIEAGGMIENWTIDPIGSVEVEFDFNARYRFQFATNPNKTRSYFVTEAGAREVSVPGYRDNVVDIFTLHPDQWRDRIVIDGSWRTIQNLEVQNSLGENFKISFQDKFFLVNSSPSSDSSSVVNYLNQFQQFQANEMISEGRFEAMDSIAATTNPFATISIDDIKNDQLIELTIFPKMQGQAYHLVIDNTGQRMVIDARRVRQILANPDRLN